MFLTNKLNLIFFLKKVIVMFVKIKKESKNCYEYSANSTNLLIHAQNYTPLLKVFLSVCCKIPFQKTFSPSRDAEFKVWL